MMAKLGTSVGDDPDPDALEPPRGVGLGEDAVEQGGRHAPRLVQMAGGEHRAVQTGSLRRARTGRPAAITSRTAESLPSRATIDGTRMRIHQLDSTGGKRPVRHQA